VEEIRVALNRAQEACTIETAWLNNQEINNLLQIRKIFADYTDCAAFYRINTGIASLDACLRFCVYVRFL
jgi:hypothetical protein